MLSFTERLNLGLKLFVFNRESFPFFSLCHSFTPPSLPSFYFSQVFENLKLANWMSQYSQNFFKTIEDNHFDESNQHYIRLRHNHTNGAISRMFGLFRYLT